jgi:ferric-dicitrate binding protein FerR (iron transport regulator)
MRSCDENCNSPTPLDLEKAFGDEAHTYAQVRADAAAEAGNEEASETWQQLASTLREERMRAATAAAGRKQLRPGVKKRHLLISAMIALVLCAFAFNALFM